MNTFQLKPWMQKINEYVELMVKALVIRKSIDQARSNAVQLAERGGRLKQQLIAFLGATEVEQLMRPMMKIVSPSEVAFEIVFLEESDQAIEDWDDPTHPLSKFNEAVWCLQEVKRIEAVMRNLDSWIAEAHRLEAKAQAIEFEMRPLIGSLKWDYFVNPALDNVPPFGYRIVSTEEPDFLTLRLIPVELEELFPSGKDEEFIKKDIFSEIREKIQINKNPLHEPRMGRRTPFDESSGFKFNEINHSWEDKFNPSNDLQ